jgi:DNA replication protein DnaC
LNNIILNDLLKEYEKKRIDAEYNLTLKKQKLYSENPRLQEIENELNSISISTAKLILKNNNPKNIENLKKNIAQLKNEKENILKSLNKPLNFLEPIFDCNICKDTGYVFDGYKTVMCSCLKQKIFDIEYNKSNIKVENFSNFRLDLYSDVVDKKLYFSDTSPKDNMKFIKKASENFIENFSNENQKNLLFTGGTGLGKTFLSNCIANELLKKNKTVLYQTAPIMLDSLISDLFLKPEIQKNISNTLLSVDLLIIDDLGTETLNSMKFTELYKIINTRLLNQNGKITKTIISTNLDLKGLLKTYDERLVSRFVGYYDIYRFYGNDIRLKKQI